MGLFSKIFSAFSGGTKQAAANTSFLQTYSGGSGGWGLDRFNSIISAHSSAEEIVDEFGLDQEGCGYMSVDGEEDSYTQAYNEALVKAEAVSIQIGEIMGMPIDPEDLIDEDDVAERAYSLALRLVGEWLSGDTWIPEEVMEWAWYDVSDHNG